MSLAKNYNTYYLPACTATTISNVYAPKALRYPEVIIPGRVKQTGRRGKKTPQNVGNSVSFAESQTRFGFKETIHGI